MGIRPLEDALRDGRIVLEGSREMRARFREWFPVHYFAGVPRMRDVRERASA